MITRRIEESDIPAIFQWFNSRKWPLPPVERIAPDWGFVAEEEGKLLACAWAYLTGRSIAFVEWTGTNPDVSDQDGMRGLIQIIEDMKKAFSQAEPPVKALCMFTQNDKLAERFQKIEFKKEGGYQRLLWSIRD